MQYRDLQKDSKPIKKVFNHNDSKIRYFLERYGKAMANGDVEALAEMWAYPSLVVGEQMSMAVTSPEQVKEFFANAKEQYNRQGIEHTRPVLEGLEWPTEHVALAWVRWPYVRDNNSAHYAESCMYTLKCDESGEIKILQALMKGNEAEKVQEIWN